MNKIVIFCLFLIANGTVVAFNPLEHAKNGFEESSSISFDFSNTNDSEAPLLQEASAINGNNIEQDPLVTLLFSDRASLSDVLSVAERRIVAHNANEAVLKLDADEARAVWGRWSPIVGINNTGRIETLSVDDDALSNEKRAKADALQQVEKQKSEKTERARSYTY